MTIGADLDLAGILIVAHLYIFFIGDVVALLGSNSPYNNLIILII